MPSIEELKARKAAGRVVARETITVTLTTGQHLVDAWKRLDNEETDIKARLRLPTGDDGEESTAQRKTSQGRPKRLDEIDAEKRELNAQMSEHQGELTLEGRDLGEWLRWVDEHPAREGNEIDNRLTGGLCNALDLLDDLGRYAVAWDGEPLGDDGWDALDIVPGDLQAAIGAVVDLHSQRFDRIPKAPKPSSTTSSGESA